MDITQMTNEEFHAVLDGILNGRGYALLVPEIKNDELQALVEIMRCDKLHAILLLKTRFDKHFFDSFPMVLSIIEEGRTSSNKQ